MILYLRVLVLSVSLDIGWNVVVLNQLNSAICCYLGWLLLIVVVLLKVLIHHHHCCLLFFLVFVIEICHFRLSNLVKLVLILLRSNLFSEVMFLLAYLSAVLLLNLLLLLFFIVVVAAVWRRKQFRELFRPKMLGLRLALFLFLLFLLLVLLRWLYLGWRLWLKWHLRSLVLSFLSFFLYRCIDLHLGW